jgi:hypothetical protein
MDSCFCASAESFRVNRKFCFDTRTPVSVVVQIVRFFSRGLRTVPQELGVPLRILLADLNKSHGSFVPKQCAASRVVLRHISMFGPRLIEVPSHSVFLLIT